MQNDSKELRAQETNSQNHDESPVLREPVHGYRKTGDASIFYNGPRLRDFETKEQYFSAYQEYWLSQISAPPLNNMGGINQTIEHVPNYDPDDLEFFDIVAKGSKGKYERIRIPAKHAKTDKHAAHIDQITFTVKISALLSRWIYPPYQSCPVFAHQRTINPEYIGNIADLIPRLSSTLFDIFGIPITYQKPGTFNFYQHTWELGVKDGHVSYGGNNDTVCVHFTGQGLLKAKAGWEPKLHDFLSLLEGKITRIDLANDLFNGEYTPQQAKADYDDGLFTLRAKKPFAECRGGGWLNPEDQSGLTFYTGKRENGKLTRVYEKGKQLMGKLMSGKVSGGLPSHIDYSKWVRVEVEYHSKDRVLPYDMLLEPGKYLAGSSPALSFISEVQEKVRTFKKIAKLTVDKVIENTKQALGRTLWGLSELYGIDKTFQLLTEGKEILPRWANAFAPVPDLDDILSESWEKELSSIPF